mgnify:CR=1 FL=1
MKQIPLIAGPHDGETIGMLEDNLKIFPIVNMTDQYGNNSSYQYTKEKVFKWIPDPSEHKPRGFVCDDNGNIIAEAGDMGEARNILDELNDQSEKWKYE